MAQLAPSQAVGRADRGASRALRAAVLGLVLFAVGASVFARHPDQSLPRHFDEWLDIGRARVLIDSGSFASPSPDTGQPVLDIDIANRNRELGFFALLGELDSVGGLDLVRHWRWLPGALLALTGLALFVFTRQVSGRFWAGIFAALFLTTLRTNNNLLGVDYFLPVSLSLHAVLLALVGLQKAHGEGRAAGLAVYGLASVFLATVYPLGLVVALMLGALCFASNPALRRDGRSCAAAAVSALVLALGIVCLEWSGSVSLTLRSLIAQLGFRGRWHLPIFEVFPVTYFATLPLLGLVLLGLAPAARRPAARVLLPWFALPLLADLAFRGLGSSVLIPYQRMWHYWQLAAFALAGIGLEQGLRWVADRVSNDRRRAAALTLLALVVFAAVIAARVREPRFLAADQVAHLPSPEVVAALDWVAANRRAPVRVHSDPDVALFVAAWTGHEATPESLASAMGGRPVPWPDCEPAADLRIGRGRCEGERSLFESDELSVYEPMRRKEQP